VAHERRSLAYGPMTYLHWQVVLTERMALLPNSRRVRNPHGGLRDVRPRFALTSAVAANQVRRVPGRGTANGHGRCERATEPVPRDGVVHKNIRGAANDQRSDSSSS
jgi:hypothetical protein